MSDLKPCRICRKAPIMNGDWATCYGDHYVTDHTMIQLKTHHWNHLMDDAPDLRYVRMGLQMAAKWHDERAASNSAISADETEGKLVRTNAKVWASEHRKMAAEIRSITDADIMKEISRE